MGDFRLLFLRHMASLRSCNCFVPAELLHYLLRVFPINALVLIKDHGRTLGRQGDQLRCIEITLSI